MNLRQSQEAVVLAATSDISGVFTNSGTIASSAGGVGIDVSGGSNISGGAESLASREKETGMSISVNTF